MAAERERKRLAMKQGFGSTLVTGPQGLTDKANTAPRTLMGGGGYTGGMAAPASKTLLGM